ncbi:Hypothetical protein HVR_LOCUS16 [uncultured virus]|nr:Hypothetical protein HVR_LOCUS16 [uncultured virus]
MAGETTVCPGKTGDTTGGRFGGGTITGTRPPIGGIIGTARFVPGIVGAMGTTGIRCGIPMVGPGVTGTTGTLT